MSDAALLSPLFVEVALTFALLFWLGPTRRRALRQGDVTLRDIALGQKAWPQRALQIANAFDNQFQLPVLFYLLTTLVLITRRADLVFVSLAWIFVLSRLAHAAVHTTTNDIGRRFGAYVVGTLA